MTAPTARPADLMRQAAIEEAVEHGARIEDAATWAVCYCHDDRHHGHPVFDRTPAHDEADALRLVAAYHKGHAVQIPAWTVIADPQRVTL